MLRKEFWAGRTMWSPANDAVTFAQRYSTTWHINEAMKHIDRKRAVVQAGGNLGQWPHYLSSHFERVYTFEPDPLNFTCLTMNTKELTNVFKFQAALGPTGARNVFLTRDAMNCEGSHVSSEGIRIPMVSIDETVCDDVDLILLDVEGYELHVLEGARETLMSSFPVVLLERRHQERYAVQWDEIDAFLDELSYVAVGTASHDVIYKYTL